MTVMCGSSLALHALPLRVRQSTQAGHGPPFRPIVCMRNARRRNQEFTSISSASVGIRLQNSGLRIPRENRLMPQRTSTRNMAVNTAVVVAAAKGPLRHNRQLVLMQKSAVCGEGRSRKLAHVE
eukprot:894457-Prorocentrum_minimum.AAC.3